MEGVSQKGKNKIDVHILVLPSTDRRLLQLCIDSFVDEPVKLHVIDGIPGHVGKARVNGFQQGDLPYVSYVDPDDLVISGAFSACLDVLQDRPDACGAYTDELLIDPQGNILEPSLWSGIPWNPLLQLEPKYLHHVCVMRRSYVEKYYLEMIRWKSMSELVLKGLLVNHGPWIHVDQFGYKWRMMPKGDHNTIPVKVIYAARWRIIPSLQKAAERHGAVIFSN